MKKALLSVLVYFLITQFLSALLYAVIALLMKSNNMAIPGPTLLSILYMLCIFIAITICWKGLKVMRIPETGNISDIKWEWALVAIVAAFMGTLAGNLLIEIMNLPDLFGEDMMDMANSIWGILTIAIIGPIAEELVLREGVCGYMIRNGSSPTKAIWVSAIIFGIIHFNPAQVAIAMIIGIILGVVYVKTGNIVVTSIIHILNNCFAVVQMKVLGEEAKDFKMVEWVGGYTLAGICIIIGFAGCFYLLRKMWENSPTPTLPEGEGEKKDSPTHPEGKGGR